MADLVRNQNGGYYLRGAAHSEIVRLKVLDEALNRSPGTTLNDIAERNGISYRTAQRWLKAYVEEGRTVSLPKG